jgi:hypothetical protein
VSDFIAQTGIFATDASVGEEVPGSEWIDTTASDYASYAYSTFPSLPLPTGYDEARTKIAVAELAAAQVKSANESSGFDSVEQESGIRAKYAVAVQCLWLDEWLQADTAGDQSRRQEAANLFADSMQWEALDKRYGDDPQTQGRLQQYVDGANGGDRTMVETTSKELICDSYLGAIQ